MKEIKPYFDKIKNFDNLSQDLIDEILNLEYLNCVIKETLRLHSPVHGVFPRVANRDH